MFLYWLNLIRKIIQNKYADKKLYLRFCIDIRDSRALYYNDSTASSFFSDQLLYESKYISCKIDKHESSSGEYVFMIPRFL